MFLCALECDKTAGCTAIEQHACMQACVGGVRPLRPPPVVASPLAHCYCLFVFSELNVILSKPTNPPVTSLPFHWLQIIERIKYNLLSLTCKVLTTTQPSYLHKLIIVQPRTLPVFLPSLRLCVRPSVCPTPLTQTRYILGLWLPDYRTLIESPMLIVGLASHRKWLK